MARGTRQVDQRYCDGLGCTDQSNFSRAFRRLNGMSPQAYRDFVIQKDLRQKRVASILMLSRGQLFRVVRSALPGKAKSSRCHRTKKVRFQQAFAGR